MPACPRSSEKWYWGLPCSIPKDSAAYLTRVGPAGHTGVVIFFARPYGPEA